MWNIAGRHHETNGHYEASTFESVVAACELCHLVHRWPNGDMNMFPSLMHRHSRKGHPVLPANQSSHSYLTNINRLQPAAIAVPPHYALRECGYEFRMMIRQAAIRRKRKKAVIKRFRARPLFDAFIDSDDNS